MTNEEFQKKMDFIIEQQAQLVVNQELADERMTRIENVVGRLATASLERIEDTEKKMSALIDSHIRLAESQARTDESLKALAASQAQTDERLNIFINVVERYISKDSNGNSEGRSKE
ncbi:MAG TPA: hypothetical protein VM943_03550, partial [Pyrinomonadaceae bacterium]|nr:hypothetical protein [Pyrinomonadaceae bacterium]